MNKNIIDNDLCTGCGVCMLECPKKCITMKMNEEGFLYPFKSDQCINCGICTNTCPRINPKNVESNFKKQAYAALSRNTTIWKNSASGGAFTEICKAWNNNKTVFVGAVWKGLKVEHRIVNYNELYRLNKSKYMASELNTIYIEIEKYLNNGFRVVFSGTPCQVAGLKTFLKREYDNLLLIDLICHGVGSPKVFNDCIRQTEIDLGCTIQSYEFRHKERVFVQDHIQKITNGNKNKLLENDRYMQLFTKQHCLRKSCGKNCIYRTKNRQGDITIGDFKGLINVFPKLNGTKKNYSTVVINTEKGSRIVNTLKENMILLECTINDIEKYNPLFAKHTYFSEKRDVFFDEYKNNPLDTIKKWTISASEYKRGIKLLFDILPVNIRRIIRIRKRLFNGK